MEYKVIKESRIIKEDSTVPMSVVITRLKKKSRIEYTTHIRFHPTWGEEPYLAHGNYFMTLDAAKRDFISRCHEYHVNPLTAKGPVKISYKV